VEVLFANGERVAGDVVIGADGAKSAVRGIVCGKEEAALKSAPVGMFNFPAALPAELALRIRAMNSLFVTSIHPDHGGMFWISSKPSTTLLATPLSLLSPPFRHLRRANCAQVQDVPSPDPATWTFQILQSWLDTSVPASFDLSTPAGRMSLFKARAATYAEPWRSVGLAIAPETSLPLDRGTYWSAPARWDNRGGCMTLAGDAAHPMTPHRGQGLNNAVQDAARFVEGMIKVRDDEVGLQDAVDSYDQEVWERGSLEVGVSLKQTMGIHNWETMMQSPMVKMGMRQAKTAESA
jgi:2-polyprenyl-6-methoxyphenol hydroxylase-like FAD-dependent oxidoreductase